MVKRDPYKARARQIVANVLEEALAVDPDSIGPRNTLYDTMGMESIDTLDIVFKLENATDVKRLDPFGQRINLTIDQGTGAYTPESMNLLRTHMPHFYDAMCPKDKAVFDRERKPTQFQNAWNYEGLVDYVAGVLKQKASESEKPVRRKAKANRVS